MFLGPLKHSSEELKLETFTMSRTGGQQLLIDGVYIDFPEEFIDDDQITFRYGVFPGEDFSPCLFPPNMKPISAVLTLHPEKGYVKFKKSVTISMPLWLCIENTDSGDHNGVTLLCANASDYVRVDGQQMLKFNQQLLNVDIFGENCTTETGETFMMPFASCMIDHCCHLCFGKTTKIDTDRNLFFLTQIKPKHLKHANDYTVHFKLTYALETCYRVSHYLINTFSIGKV